MPSDNGGCSTTQTLLRRGIPFSAIFCASDLTALGAIRALGEAGLRVPEDVSVVGFDDIPSAAFVNPPLTTVRQDTAAAGKILVETLLRLIRGEPAESSLIQPELIHRLSTAAPPAA